MIRVGVVGRASIFQKKWRQALENNPNFKLIGVARREVDPLTKDINEREGYYSFSPDEIDLVYIPLPNSLHYDVAKFYLLAGKNVVIEKPATLNFNQTNELIQIANQHKVFFIEGFQWRYHARTNYLINILNKQHINLIDVVFTVPHFDSANIRYAKHLGGGATSDLGAYPVSVISTLCKQENFDLKHFEVHYQDEYEVDLGGHGYFKSDTNIILRFFYRIGLPYESRLMIYTDNGRYEINQPFTVGAVSSAFIRHEQNLILDEVDFIDCHFKSFLDFIASGFDYLEENNRTLIQAKYHSMLLDRVAKRQ